MTTGPLALAVIVALATAVPHLALRAWIVWVFAPGVRARRGIDAVVLGLYAALSTGIYLSHRPERPWPWLSFVSYTWLGMSILLTVIAVPLVGSLGVLRLSPLSRDRRRFFAKAGTVLAGGALVPLSGAAMASALGAVRVERVPLRLPALRAPTRLVQLSDVHLGPTLGREWLLGIVARVNALRPDVVVITGDLVDGLAHDLERELEPLRLLEAPEGVFFVTGNHEYFYDADALVAHLHTLGVRTLRNESVELRGLRLAGVDDLSAGADFAAVPPGFGGTKSLNDLEASIGNSTKDMLDQLIWWTQATKTARG